MGNMREITIGTLIFDCRVSGKEEDELVILLHGFPETSYMWIGLMHDISALGFYCIAPNLRGYSKGARPNGKKQYSLDKLVEDVIGIAKSVGRERFHLIGHDWGAAIGWKTVHDHPNSILSWTGLSIPHLQSFCEAMEYDKQQKLKSRYIKALQMPILPEINIRKNDFEVFKKLWKHSSKEEVENYISIFKSKKALTSALHYYRSNYKLFKKAAKAQILGDIHVPTLFIWGEHDMAVSANAVKKGHDYVKGYYKFLQLDAGHWLVQSEYPEIKTAVAEHLLKFKSTTA